MMMMKSFIFQQQQQDQENMSNLTTSASGEASISSSGGGRELNQNNYHPPPEIPPSNQPPPKKKRNMPGNPDPDSEVISLSPTTLMATNRFLCEICNKGFQRDQNLQLHRRGHNLPWKLKQRAKNEVVKKKVYVCPEPSCVHHEPSRALGDLTGIKKHFSRKHGEKKWKCEKCSKKYAVQSDWKAHSKTCGTREYRCDCGTLFSRRDSFITHRAFCDALAEESARAIPTAAAATATTTTIPQFNHQGNNNNNFLHYPFSSSSPSPSLKKEDNNITTMDSNGNFGLLNNSRELPPWLASCPPAGLRAAAAASSVMGSGPGPGPLLPHHLSSSSSSSSSSPSILSGANPSQLGPTLPNFHSSTTQHMSATALLQKAAQMGATTASTTAASKTAGLMLVTPTAHPDHHHVTTNSNSNAGFGFAPRDSVGTTAAIGGGGGGGGLFQEMMNYSFEAVEDGGGGTTRDFLGLRPLTHSDLLSLAGFGNCINDDDSNNNNNADHQHSHESQKQPWQGN
ncbi:unnamed protein product [Linum tenue]|uniref:C2H2-type domain-containing protein n=1 Tax=Linum tenue TaxID=586396 RepID=A0AAV0PQV0_9ROSI|nr:unnamed protein product [Linum tenue]